jgi:hypothetical protein
MVGSSVIYVVGASVVDVEGNSVVVKTKSVVTTVVSIVGTPWLIE